jgi:predicted SAM-dependent methyltransferase
MWTQPKIGWLNVDLFNSAADLRLDLRNPWPFQDASAAHIYSEHIFEHFDPEEEVPHYFAESKRVLAPGGILDIGVPDTEWPLRAYGHPEDPYWQLVSTACTPAAKRNLTISTITSARMASTNTLGTRRL